MTQTENNGATFPGFPIPTKNFFHMPNNWTDITAEIKSLAELKVVEYVLRHTWGFHEFGIKKAITTDEFMHGRLRGDGTRMDKGTGLSNRSVIDGLRAAEEHGYLVSETDNTDKARSVKYYMLKMAELAVKNLHTELDMKNVHIGYEDVSHLDMKDVHSNSEECSHRSEKETIERNYRKKPKKDTCGDNATASHHAPTLVSHPEHDFLWFDDLLAPSCMVIRWTPAYPSRYSSEQEDERRGWIAEEVRNHLEAKGLKIATRTEHETEQEIEQALQQNENHSHTSQEEMLQDAVIPSLHRDLLPATGRSIRDHLLPDQTVASHASTTAAVAGTLSYSPSGHQPKQEGGIEDDRTSNGPHHRVSRQSHRDRDLHSPSTLTDCDRVEVAQCEGTTQEGGIDDRIPTERDRGDTLRAGTRQRVHRRDAASEPETATLHLERVGAAQQQTAIISTERDGVHGTGPSSAQAHQRQAPTVQNPRQERDGELGARRANPVVAGGNIQNERRNPVSSGGKKSEKEEGTKPARKPTKKQILASKQERIDKVYEEFDKLAQEVTGNPNYRYSRFKKTTDAIAEWLDQQPTHELLRKVYLEMANDQADQRTGFSWADHLGIESVIKQCDKRALSMQIKQKKAQPKPTTTHVIYEEEETRPVVIMSRFMAERRAQNGTYASTKH